MGTARLGLLVPLALAASLCLTACGDEVPAPVQAKTEDQGVLRGSLDVDRLAANRTTNSPFVLVTIVNGTTGEARTAAIDYQALGGAVATERGIRGSAVTDYLRGARSRRFVFADPTALKNVWPRYPSADLDEARALLQERTSQEIVSRQNTLDSDLNRLSERRHGAPYGYMHAVIQMLLERGDYCGASCIPGLVYIE